MYQRTPQTQARYDQWRKDHPNEEGCFICTREPLQTCGKYWKIISNNFPYDAIASKSDMLVPLRHFAGRRDMNEQESAELSGLLEKWETGSLPDYNAIIENFGTGRTQKNHYHIHVVAIK